MCKNFTLLCIIYGKFNLIKNLHSVTTDGSDQQSAWARATGIGGAVALHLCAPEAGASFVWSHFIMAPEISNHRNGTTLEYGPYNHLALETHNLYRFTMLARIGLYMCERVLRMLYLYYFLLMDFYVHFVKAYGILMCAFWLNV